MMILLCQQDFQVKVSERVFGSIGQGGYSELRTKTLLDFICIERKSRRDVRSARKIIQKAVR